MKKEIYLPLFQGFYCTIHSLDDDILLEDFDTEIKENTWNYSQVTSEDKDLITNWHWDLYSIYTKYYDIKYKEYENDYWEIFFNIFKENFWNDLEKIWINLLNFINIESPKKYNFDIAHINVEVHYNIPLIKEFLIKEKEHFSSYIKKQNTSYDWFFAYWTNSFDEYINKLDFEPFELTQIIDFYLSKINIDIVDLHYEVIWKMDLFNYISKK